MTNHDPNQPEVLTQALDAFERGWTPLPIRSGSKTPAVSGWSGITYETADDVRKVFLNAADFHKESLDSFGLSVSLGEASNGLVDVDLDHPKALRLRDLFLPHTAMMSGRASTRRAHLWYRVSEDLPEGTKRYKLPTGETTVELRSTGGQTLVPPSMARCVCSKTRKGAWCKNGSHLTYPEAYLWEGGPWGGREGPAEIAGKILAARVATLALAIVLVDGWPRQGSRHECYLALAGGLLRYGTGDSATVHPLWEQALPGLIGALATATDDEDGPESRIHEVIGSTLERLREGRAVQGFPTLAGLIGQAHVDLVIRYAREVETILGHASRPSSEPITTEVAGESLEVSMTDESAYLDAGERNPLDERSASWEPVNLGPYLDGEVEPVEPGLLYREDGVGLIYPGRVNTLYGRSESGKSWIAFQTAVNVIEQGEKVMYLDCEDDPQQTVERLRLLGASDDAIRHNFTYVRPESPLGALMFSRWGEHRPSDSGERNDAAFKEALANISPSLIVVDGLSVLYGIHGLDTNDTSSTERLTGWFKRLTANHRRTVIIIDHTAKNASLGATPLGSQHKVAMIQGVALQVHPVTRPVPGRVGEVWLHVGKDRLGTIRQNSTDEEYAIASKVFIHSEPNRVRFEFTVPTTNEVILGDDDALSQKLSQLDLDMQAVWEACSHEWLSSKEIKLGMIDKISDKRFDRALKSLIADQMIEKAGETKGAKYRII